MEIRASLESESERAKGVCVTERETEREPSGRRNRCRVFQEGKQTRRERVESQPWRNAKEKVEPVCTLLRRTKSDPLYVSGAAEVVRAATLRKL